MNSMLSARPREVLIVTFTLSVAFEPLLYFMLYDPGQFGFGTNVSRVLQLVTIFLILIDFSLKSFSLKFAGPYDWVIARYIVFYLFCLISGLYGVIYGAWDIGFSVPHFRILSEYVITLYYFLYFVLLAGYLLREKKEIDLFFKLINTLLGVSFFVGVVSLLFRYVFDYAVISRHFSGFVDVGVRFHGLFGEPRDAAVGLVLWMSLLYLKDCYSGIYKLSKLTVMAILAAIMLTFSMSAVVGVLFSITMVAVYLFFLHSNHVQKIKILLGIFLVSILSVVLIGSSDRLSRYISDIGQTYTQVESGVEVSTILASQMVDIYPFFHRFSELEDLDIAPILIGSGLGSSSVINRVYIKSDDLVNNPRSNVTRYFFDLGLIGVAIYLWLFVSIVQKISIYFSASDRKYLMISALSILGMSLAHRSASIFIYLGTLLVVGFYKRRESLKK